MRAADDIADEILARQAAPRRPGDILAPPVPTPSRPKSKSFKKVLRAALREELVEFDGKVYSDRVNRVTNVVWRLIKASRAKTWAEGYEAGADDVSSCCGCGGPADQTPNPYA